MIRLCLVAILAVGAGLASAQQTLRWKPNKPHQPFTALYGQITVLVDQPGTYFCGVDWWAGHPAAGTTGIQIDSPGQKRVMFSVWPTDKKDDAFPRVAQTNPHLGATWAKNDVHGAHCDADFGWQERQTYQFYLTKRIDDSTGAIVVSLYFFDEARREWVGEGRILSPIDGKSQVPNFDGGLTSELADLLGKGDEEREKPRLALYRLWAGTSPGDLQMITTASGSGTWGVMNGAFYLASGDDGAIIREMQRNLGPDGAIQPGKKKDKLEIPSQPVPANVVEGLGQLH